MKSRGNHSALSRRTLLATLAAAGGLIGERSAAAATARAPRGQGWQRLRRVVTSEDADGTAVLLFDGEPTNSFELNGSRITRLWETPAVPAELPLRSDAGASAASAYREGFGGTSFYVAELPGGRHVPRIPLHKNATVDYMAILSGRIVLSIGTREIELHAGDTIVQGGNEHTWINRWDEPCLLLFVVISGARGGSAPKIA
jgi:mannose-6-phosphate isomerase-like protein (cupin superfamily)